MISLLNSTRPEKKNKKNQTSTNLLKRFLKIQGEAILPNSFYKTRVTLAPKQGKNTRKRGKL
jgi:hypothetical protein